MMPNEAICASRCRRPAAPRGQVQQSRAAQTAVNKDCEAELDPLQDSEPMKLAEERRHVLTLPRRVDEPGGSVEN